MFFPAADVVMVVVMMLLLLLLLVWSICIYLSHTHSHFCSFRSSDFSYFFCFVRFATHSVWFAHSKLPFNSARTFGFVKFYFVAYKYISNLIAVRVCVLIYTRDVNFFPLSFYVFMLLI